jgi:hypothetical protein
VLVERRLGQVRTAVVAGGDVGASDADLGLVPGRDERQLEAGQWDPEDVAAGDREVCRGRRRRALGQSPGRGHLHAGAVIGGELLDPVPQLLRQRRGGGEADPQPVEQCGCGRESLSRWGTSVAHPAGTLR